MSSPEMKILIDNIDSIFAHNYVDEEEIKMLMIKTIATKQLSFEEIDRLLKSICEKYTAYINYFHGQ